MRLANPTDLDLYSLHRGAAAAGSQCTERSGAHKTPSLLGVQKDLEQQRTASAARKQSSLRRRLLIERRDRGSP